MGAAGKALFLVLHVILSFLEQGISLSIIRYHDFTKSNHRIMHNSAFTRKNEILQKNDKLRLVSKRNDYFDERGEDVDSVNCRRTMLQASFLSFLLLPISGKSAKAAVIQQIGTCVSGEGSVCEDLSEGNEFIQSLQQKSAENRE